MEQTTLSKTARAAELLAASIVINELVKEGRRAGSPISVLLEKQELLATLAAATFTPAEA